MRSAFIALSLALPALGGCLAGPFDGTWLLSFDQNPIGQEGTCVDPDDTTTSTSEAYDLVDIYTNAQGGIVVLMEMSLSGTIDGRSFTASGIEEAGDEDFTDSQEVTMVGTLEGKVLSGKVTSSWFYEWGGDPSDCTTAWSYTAERVDSDPDDYIEED